MTGATVALLLVSFVAAAERAHPDLPVAEENHSSPGGRHWKQLEAGNAEAGLLAKRNEVVFTVLNQQLKELNQATGRIQWASMTGTIQPSDLPAHEVAEIRTSWRNSWCNAVWWLPQGEAGDSRPLQGLNDSQRRQAERLCRGPKYTPSQSKEVSLLLGELGRLYAGSRACRGPLYPCYNVEPELEQLMRHSRDPAELLWAWHTWREVIGPPSRALYPLLIQLQNIGAVNNGYNDMGDCWREELETRDLESVVDQLYLEIRPLFRKLHTFVRLKLAQVYDFEPTEFIPAHLLGNMWAQNWDSLLPLLLDSGVDLEASFLAKNYTVQDMVEHADTFYQSLGLPAMPDEFWQHSQILKPKNTSLASCHGTAANMYNGDDYRMLMCASVSLEDYYVIHHEMGHLQYYMAYSHLPTIFQEGATSAFQEAVGDSVMLGVMSVPHLRRIGLLDPSVSNPDDDIALLLRMALNKLPQLAFGLTVDRWRWGVMRGTIPPARYNLEWWALQQEYLGVSPPTARTEDQFDPAAKYHIPDNTPYIRYYLAGFLQMQFLEAMCIAAQQEKGDDVIPPLHRCDIYGSLKAGKQLVGMMRLGASTHWSQALLVMTAGRYDFYSSKALLNYFQPLESWLDQQIPQQDIAARPAKGI